MDFDDLLLKTNELLFRHPDVLPSISTVFNMFDEYQDTNHSQYLIVKALAALNENICVVGDDAYNFILFAVNIRNILNFKSDYSDVKLIAVAKLPVYKNIVSAANSVIEKIRVNLIKKYGHQ